MTIHQIAVSQNNKAVYAHMLMSKVAPVLSRQPHLMTLLKEVIASQTLTKPVIQFEYDMKRQIGYEEIVSTTGKDTVFYARKYKTDTFTRFVKHRKMEGTQYLSGTLTLDKEGNYEISDVWLGKQWPAAPDTEAATEASTEFWRTHAVVYNGQQIIASTQTYESPYEQLTAV